MCIRDRSKPGTSRELGESTAVTLEGNCSPTSTLSVPVSQISPLPRAASMVQKKTSVRQNALILTSTPYKSQLEESIEKRKPKTLQFTSNETAKKRKQESVSSWFCDLCEEDAQQDMIQCMLCKKWVHEECAGVKKWQKKYFCVKCKQSKKI